MSSMLALRTKIQNQLQRLNHGLVERDATLKAALLTVLAGENIVLIGPPGTGKSMLARRIAESLGSSTQQGSDYFEYLLTKFSTPEELFGPLSISALKQDVFQRNTSGYLPSVQLAFLDEIFKASSSILNALLTILNERVFHNGASAEPVPLKALIAASNELPTGQEELSALYDRFLVRSFVGYVSEEGRAQLFTASTKNAPTAEPITAQDLEALRQAAEAVTLPPTIQQALLEIWRKHQDTFKEDTRESLSDRRLMKCLHLMRISAATNGRTEVDASDLLLLKNCLWNHPDNSTKVRELIYLALLPPDIKKPVINNPKNTLIEIKVPDIGDFDSVGVIEVLVRVGDYVAVEQSLITVESDKASMEIPSSHAGTVKAINVGLGDKVSEGSVILLLENTSNSASPSPSPSPHNHAEKSLAYQNTINTLSAKMTANIWL